MTSGGGFGALDTMNKTLKNNRALLKKINVFERVKNYNSSLKGRKINVPKKKISKYQLEEIKAKTLREGRKQTVMKMIKITLVLSVVITLLILFIAGALNR